MVEEETEIRGLGPPTVTYFLQQGSPPDASSTSQMRHHGGALGTFKIQTTTPASVPGHLGDGSADTEGVWPVPSG